MIREMRKKNRQISQDSAYDIVKKSEYGLLTTVSEDGSPYCIPVSYALIGKDIYFHCAKQGHKIDNITRDNRVCFTVVGKTNVLSDIFTTEYESAVAFGTVEIMENSEEILTAILKICEKYSPEYRTQAVSYAQREMDNMYICRIRIEHITGKANFRK